MIAPVYTLYEMLWSGGVYFTERNENRTQVPEVNVCIH